MGGGGRVGGGGQGGCERRIEVFVKIQKKNWGEVRGVGRGGGGSGWGGGGGSGWGVQGGCERRIEVFGKIHKKKKSVGGIRREGLGGGRDCGGVRVDVNAMMGDVNQE